MNSGDFSTQMRAAGFDAEDVVESFARSSGPGGQHVNKTSTAVTLRHHPSGASVTVQDSRSQATNRKLARERLIEAIKAKRRDAELARVASKEQARRRDSPRPPRLKRRILESKRKRSTLKKLRSMMGE